MPGMYTSTQATFWRLLEAILPLAEAESAEANAAIVARARDRGAWVSIDVCIQATTQPRQVYIRALDKASKQLGRAGRATVAHVEMHVWEGADEEGRYVLCENKILRENMASRWAAWHHRHSSLLTAIEGDFASSHWPQTSKGIRDAA